MTQWVSDVHSLLSSRISFISPWFSNLPRNGKKTLSFGYVCIVEDYVLCKGWERDTETPLTNTVTSFIFYLLSTPLAYSCSQLWRFFYFYFFIFFVLKLLFCFLFLFKLFNLIHANVGIWLFYVFLCLLYFFIFLWSTKVFPLLLRIPQLW